MVDQTASAREPCAGAPPLLAPCRSVSSQVSQKLSAPVCCMYSGRLLSHISSGDTEPFGLSPAAGEHGGAQG